MSSLDSENSTRPGNTGLGMPLLFIALATVVGGLLRFSALGGRDFWFDESCTYIYVHYLFDWPFASSFFVESTNTPYYFLLRIWSDCFGETEAAYRSLSAMAATVTIPILGATAWRLRGSLAGVIAAVLVAANPLHVYYAREARAYALWVLALSCALYALIEAAKMGRNRWWVAFGAAMLFSLYTHYFSVYFLVASVFCIFLSTDARRTGRQWAITASVVALGFVPCLVVAVLPAASLGGAKWVAPAFDALTAIPHSLWAMLPSGAYPNHLRGLSIASTETASQASLLVTCARVVPAVLLAAIAAIALWRKSMRVTARRRDYFFLLGVSIGPLVLALLYAIVVSPNYLVGRYDLVAWPAFLVLVSIVVSELARTVRKGFMLMLIACAILVGCSTIPLMRMSDAPGGKSLYRSRAEAVASLAGADDLVITFSYDRDAMLYYLHRAGCDARIRSFPGWLDEQIGWVDSSVDLSQKRRPAAIADAQELAEIALGYIEKGQRVFLAADTMDPESEGLRSELHTVLLASLREAGLGTVGADREMLIYEVVRQE